MSPPCWTPASIYGVQIAARHADPRTTMRYDRARNNLDRHPNYILAAYMASGTGTVAHAEGRLSLRAPFHVSCRGSLFRLPPRTAQPSSRTSLVGCAVMCVSGWFAKGFI